MIHAIPDEIISIYKSIESARFEVYLVGGCVRGLLLQKAVKDWDLTTNASPDNILSLFPNGFYDNQFGTVGIPVTDSGQRAQLSQAPLSGAIQNDEKNIVEITTFRTEHGYSDKRRPDKVLWGKTINEDLSRRDFTINAIALKLNLIVVASGARQSNPEGIAESAFDETHNGSSFELIDPFNGQKDLESKIIRAVGDPKQRFKEDSLRLMRAIRFAAVLDFNIERETWQEIMNDASLITHISFERIRDELLKILASEKPYEGIILLQNAKLLEHIIPELLEGTGVSQVRPGRHHTNDVFTHNLLSLKFCPSKDPIVRLATLLHDIGKPKVVGTDQQGLVVFHNHEIVGAKMAYEICDRLRLSKKQKEKITTLIRWHMFTVDEHTTDAAIRRFIRRVRVENIKDMIDLRIGDRLGSGTKTAESWRLKLFKKRVEEQLTPGPFSINDLAVDGNDVMRVLNIKPGPRVGEILQKLFEEVDENLSLNNREHLLKRVKELS
ncbi:MAG: hypothetical protein A3F31_03960 [Candidatus Levybacteria bacterium RIFCSPHIGHO2_12_FULL_38_12]|nr:MAG: hypothetical protein A3D75_00570 [Candidatus Levybacteria bacterium RIFCSPHIGHO2_02_FULL_37_18]OGH22852.1 MAG: hypothetical protein A3F31_03960 [Candidatus Levybacteria bacterium RIFCSPHIGHO2_12_FULL_38_12]OGH33577.1 MAG: hypothetical protein A3A47_01915 [Candidatus Levybacteria bacterium RIFCSPLOWO2_01_FULL_37_20]OGH44498.1 MAG: hypothetical protein A3J14_03605 [Candidatus Levybacteria bacterium RIFCSPLOWO2_02_FULL_37_18]OGH52449.1 MAG: hypothetical protein A3G13_00555 [Candidatus Levy